MKLPDSKMTVTEYLDYLEREEKRRKLKLIFSPWILGLLAACGFMLWRTHVIAAVLH